MNILPISFNSFYKPSVRFQNENRTSNIFCAQNLAPLKADTVTLSFQGSAPNAEPLRRLLAYGIPDLYSNIILMNPENLNAIMKTHLSSLPLNKLVKKLNPYVDSMFPVERTVFRMLKTEARVHPKMRLNEFIHKLVPEHSKRLRKLQRPIFEELNQVATNMPADLLAEYNYLAHITNKKLYNEPVFVPFSIRGFKYKLDKIRKRINSSNDGYKKQDINKLCNIAKSITYVPKEKRFGNDFSLKRYERKQRQMILKFADYFNYSRLKDDKDLKELVEISKGQIFKVPMNIQFNRKTFIYDLKKITDRLEDRRLARRMEQLAVSLPTSKDDISAFIMKAAGRSAEQIVFDLLGGACGTVDHLLAAHNKGASSLANYGLASAYKNSQKAHQSLAVLLDKNPDVRIYCQRQINRLIELANNKTFKKIGLDPSYIISLAKKLEKLSPKNDPLILDTSKLKY